MTIVAPICRGRISPVFDVSWRVRLVGIQARSEVEHSANGAAEDIREAWRT